MFKDQQEKHGEDVRNVPLRSERIAATLARRIGVVAVRATVRAEYTPGCPQRRAKDPF